MKKIKNWTITISPNTERFQAPELQQVVLAGDVYNHSEIEDGKHIFTSPILKITGRTIITKTGSIYYLDGEPHQFFLDDVLSKHNIIYNPEDPLGFLND